jgi:hypothetical protein
MPTVATDEDNHREGSDVTAEPHRVAFLVPRSRRLLLDLDDGQTLAMVYPGLSLLRAPLKAASSRNCGCPRARTPETLTTNC